jgi:Flp pilus assembly protein TadD
MATLAGPRDQTRYPTSGQLVGWAASFLRLKGFLRDEASDPDDASYKSAQRYFGGESTISPEIADSIIDRLLCDFLPLAALPPEILPASASPLEWLQSTVKDVLRRWDQLAGKMNGENHPLSSDRYAPVPYLRLFTLDLALRWAAYQTTRLDLRQDPDSEPYWVRVDGLRVVTDVLRKGGNEALTLDVLAEKAGLSLNTLEAWRGGDTFPTHDEKVANLVTALATHSGVSRPLVDFRLRVAAGAAALYKELTSLCGEERVRDLVATFSKVVRLAVRILRFAPIPGEAWATEMAAFARSGAHARLGPIVCQKLAEHSPSNPEVQADFLALPHDWEPRLNYWAKRVSELSRFPVEAVQAEGVDPKLAEMVWQGLPTMVLTMSDFDMNAEDRQPIKIAADASVKAHAHFMQAQQVESLGDLFTAVKHMKQAVTLQPQHAEYRFFFGAYLGQLDHAGVPGVQDEALAQCRRAHDLRPEWDRPPTEIGIILSNAGRYEEAEAQLAAAEPIARGWDHFHYARGMNYLGLGRFDDAARSLRTSLALKGDRPGAMVRLGAALAMLGQVDGLPRLAKEIRHHGGPQLRDLDDWRRYADPRVALD